MDLESRCFVRRGNALLPADIHAEAFLNDVKEGQEILVRAWKPRNAAQHRKMFAILHAACEQSHKWQDVDELSDVLKLACGHSAPRQLPDGTIVRVPKSISYASMPASAFERFYARAMYCLGQMLGYDPDTLLKEKGGGVDAATDIAPQ